MSDSTPESTNPTPPPTVAENNDLGRDIILWRKKKLSLAILAAATATWVALQLYQFNFLTLISWVSMAVVILVFLWGNLLKLFNKEAASVSDFQIPEKFVSETANLLRRYGEEGVRWLFHVGAERECLGFLQAVGSLWLLSLVGSCFDFVSLLYIGVLMGMTVPIIYVKYEGQIKRCMDKMKDQGRRLYSMVDEKLLNKLKHKFGSIINQEKEQDLKKKKPE